MSLAEQYYIKALDYYPYDLEEFLESIRYALSYDPEHAGAHHLMGKFCMEQLSDHDRAEEHFITSLCTDPSYAGVYEDYILLMLHQREFEKAQKLIDHARTLKNADRGVTMKVQALYYEYAKEYQKALYWLGQAMEETYTSEDMCELEEIWKRVEEKLRKQSRISVVWK